MHPDYTLLADPVLGPNGWPSGASPTTLAQIKHWYGFDQVKFNNGTVAGDGSGETIAIVDAYDDPNFVSSTDPNFANSSLHTFDTAFGLPDPVFTKVNQNGGSTLPAADGGWGTEIALDVEWAHAIAPRANVLLVEANSNSTSNLLAAVDYARRQAGVVAVSMSWGSGEFGGETGYDSTFSTPAGHAGVTFVASTGDNGAPVEWPAISPNVLGVGGTSLAVDGSGNVTGESGWGGSGGGISTLEAQPGYQQGLTIHNGGSVIPANGHRAGPDVSYDADPASGFYVYNGGWAVYGGTSAAAPQWAALIAIADQGRALAGAGSLDGPSQTLPDLYQLSASDFIDVTSGTSIGNPNYTAGPGYDLVTGRGSPVANLIIGGLNGPQAEVLDGSSQVADGGSASFSALPGSSGTHTFTVENAGTGTLTLSNPISLPSGFTLVSGFGSTSLAAGASTTFTVAIANTASAASYSGTVSFGTSDPNNSPFTFTLTGTVAPSVVLDNGQAGFSEAGSGWTHYTGAGYNNNLDYAAAGTGANTATWQLTGLASGTYDAQVTWTAVANHATNATYSVYDGGTLLKTVTVNQQQAPSGATVNGSTFQSLGQFQVNSGTLKVVLSDSANGYVIADAMRVVSAAAAAAQVQVTAGSQAVANGGTFAMSALVGQAASQTFTVTNTGGATLTLSDPITLPGGFSLSSDFGSTSLAPGQSTSFAVQMNTSSAASYSGAVSFGTNVSGQNPFSFTLSGTVASSALIDNGQAGFSETGSGWTHYTGAGYNNTVDYAAAGTGANTATWQLTGLASGTYDAQVTWTAVFNHATNATYSVYDGGTLLNTVTVNQQQAPSGTTVNGSVFQSLGQYKISSGTLKVVLTDNANGYVIADAFRAAVATATGTIIDNGQSGFTETGTGWTHYTGAGYNNTVDYAAAGTGANTATWQFAGLASGTYDAQVTWTAVFNHATNATYGVYDGNTLLGTFTVNQQQAPTGTTVNGSTFQSLGLFQITSGTLKVVLTDNANGYVIADAARVVAS
jgi:hypothetical protein